MPPAMRSEKNTSPISHRTTATERHGTNLLLLSSGRGGLSPIVGQDGELADPIPQALILTSIVISLAVVTFLLAMAYRNYRLTRETEIADDPDDAIAADQVEAPGGGE